MRSRTIISGLMIDYNKHCNLQFGEYVQNHESYDKSTGTERTIKALGLRPTGNEQGGSYFYSLRTGSTINHNRCIPLPMPDDVIIRIHALSRNDPMRITFTDRNENETKEDDDDNDYIQSNEEDIEDYHWRLRSEERQW